MSPNLLFICRSVGSSFGLKGEAEEKQDARPDDPPDFNFYLLRVMVTAVRQQKPCGQFVARCIDSGKNSKPNDGTQNVGSFDRQTIDSLLVNVS